jgi:hypothetical protein
MHVQVKGLCAPRLGSKIYGNVMRLNTSKTEGSTD